jgi:hypothetical protein
MRNGNLSYEDSILHVMKRDVMRQKSLGLFAYKKVQTTGATGETTTDSSSAATILAKSEENRLLRQQECLKADQVNPFIDANEPDIIDRRDIGAVLDQHVGPRQGNGLFGRRVGHSLKLAKFGVYSAASSVIPSHGVSSSGMNAAGAEQLQQQRTSMTGSASMTASSSMNIARRLMVPSQQRPVTVPTTVSSGYRVWPIGSNVNPPRPASTTEGAMDQVP